MNVKHMLLDCETSLTNDLVGMIDKKMNEIIDQCNTVEDPEMFGYFDSAEHLTGLGFVICQTYLTAVSRPQAIRYRVVRPCGPFTTRAT